MTDSTAFGSRYLLGAPLGRGGMGTVYRGVVRDSGGPVAIKVLRDDLSADPDIVARFIQERQVLRSIDHPNVVHVRDLVVEGDRLGIVMDLVDGGDLRHAVAFPMRPDQAIPLIHQIAGGLAAVHRAGVVHRDLKPENVLVSATQPVTLRLTDFGVSRLLSQSLTKVTSMIGTPGYLAPELAAGEQPTPAADIYALGVVMHEMLCGRPPFEASNILALLRAHADEPVQRPQGLPDFEWQLLSVMLAKSPHERPTAEQIEVMTGAPSAPPTSWATPLPRQDTDEMLVRATRSDDLERTVIRNQTPIITTDDIPKAVAGRSFGPPAASDTMPDATTVITSRPIAVPPPPVAPAATPLPTAAQPVRPMPPGGRRQRHRGAVFAIAAVGVIGLAIGAIAELRTDEPVGTTPAAQASEYAFPPVVYPGDVAVRETWQLIDDGARLQSTVEVTNNGSSESSGDHYLVIPKTVASDVSMLTFDPEPNEIVERDPVVRYDLGGIEPGSSLTITWSAAVDPAGLGDDGLEGLATDQIAAERQFRATFTGAPAPVVLQELRIEPTALAMGVGQSSALTVSGTMSDGTAAPDDLLPGVTWSSNDDAVVTVTGEGVVSATGPGAATVTVTLGDIQAFVTVEVSAVETTLLDATTTAAPSTTVDSATTTARTAPPTTRPAPSTTKPATSTTKPAPSTTKPPATTTTKPPATTTTKPPAPQSTVPPPPAIFTQQGAPNPSAPFPNASWVIVNGQRFTPNSALFVICEGDPRQFSLGTTDSAGNFSRQSVCYHTPGVGQLITVRDASGRTATTRSFW